LGDHQGLVHVLRLDDEGAAEDILGFGVGAVAGDDRTVFQFEQFAALRSELEARHVVPAALQVLHPVDISLDEGGRARGLALR
jgi:hypothetical protein